MADNEGGLPRLQPMSHEFSHIRHANQTLNAVSFGFIATAVLFAMFLVMAIFERILRPHLAARAAARDEERTESIPESSTDSQKPEVSHSDSYSKAVSVLMPGQDYPTYFAVPIPPCCPPEGIVWPAHDHGVLPVESDKENLHDLEMGLGDQSASTSPSSWTKVSQDAGKDKGESSSSSSSSSSPPPSPDKVYDEDVEKAGGESSNLTSRGKEPVLQYGHEH